MSANTHSHSPIHTAVSLYLHASLVATRCYNACENYKAHHAADTFSAGLDVAQRYSQDRATAARRCLLEALRAEHTRTGFDAFTVEIRGIERTVTYFPALYLFDVDPEHTFEAEKE